MSDRIRTINSLRALLGRAVESDNYVVILRECDRAAIEDAVSLLTSGTWVLTLEEALNAKGPVYVQLRGDLLTMQAFLEDKGEVIRANSRQWWGCDCPRDSYMTQWRCWNTRPTDQQLYEEPWKEMNESGNQAD